MARHQNPELREQRRKEGQKYNDRRKKTTLTLVEVAAWLGISKSSLQHFHNGTDGMSVERKQLYSQLLDNPELFYISDEVREKPVLSSKLDCLYKNLSTAEIEELMTHPKIGPAIPKKWLEFHGLIKEPEVIKPKTNSDIAAFKQRAQGLTKGSMYDEFSGEI